MEEKNINSIMDAFIALRDADDDIVMPTVKGNLKEGYAFDVRDSKALDRAAEVINEPEADVELEVIDTDADTIQHLKDKSDYVGDLILVCDRCGAARCIDPEQLTDAVVVEDSEGNQKELYNMNDECAHCHAQHGGFRLGGQIGRVAEDEPELENDEAMTDEETFDKVEDEESVEETGAAEDETSEEEFEFDSDEELAYDETNAEDDTLDMEDKTGTEFDENDVAWDDTEEHVEETSEEETKSDEEDEEEVTGAFVKAKDTNESLDEPEEKLTIKDFLNFVVEPENIEEVLIRDVNRDADDDAAVLYHGSFAELPHKFFERAVEAFSNGQNEVINILVNKDGDKFLGEVLPLVDKYAEAKVNLWDDESHDLVFSDALDKLERPNTYFFKALETPKFICFSVKAAEDDDRVEKAEKSEEDKLVEAIINSNNMRPLNLNDSTSNEYWINECVKAHEDLEVIYEQYVVGDSKLEEQFTRVTGFLSQERKDQIINESMSGNDFSELVKLATECGYETLADIQNLMHEKNLSEKELLPYLKDECSKKHECVKEAAENLKVFNYVCDPSGVEGEIEAKDLDDACRKVETLLAEKGIYVADEIVDIYAKEDEKESLDEATDAHEEDAEHLDIEFTEDEPKEEEISVDEVEEETPAEDEISVEEVSADEEPEVKAEEQEEEKEELPDVEFTTDEVKELAQDVAEEAAEKAVELQAEEELDDETKDEVADLADEKVADAVEEKTLKDEAADEVAECLIGSYKTRKELAEAIEECKNNNKPYSVRRSTTEGFRWDLLNKASEEACPECAECETEDDACCDDFDQLSFEKDINDYFKDAYERPICFKADSHECCDDHSIKCCGKVCSDDIDTDIVFVLVPVLNEELGTVESYNVTNNLSDEEMIYTK